MSRSIPRRDFIRTTTAALGGAALAACSLAPLARAAVGDEVAGEAAGNRGKPRYRAVSWWLTWEDLTWPNPELMDKIRRRADQCAASSVNCCVIFGAHFRWDFMPLWDRLHDELRFVADELHQRNILLFDHHSSGLTHRPRNREEALHIWENNRHHIPFYPSPAEAAVRQFDGSLVNDWRMLDVETGGPIYLPTYNAEQYCMNHPRFRAAYPKYLTRLKTETGIDGLMSDDAIFYADWRACACPHCRERFKSECGHDLPPVSEANFWGNRRSEAFRDWIAMRFRSSGDFLGVVQKVFPSGFPLLTCCSSSDGYRLPAFGMSYQDFIRHCNHVMLEMVGSTPSLAGTWDDRIPSQLLHLEIARDHGVPCFGLGYGFFPDTAFFVWALNKFLGSDSWFSTLKGRLDASPAELAGLADDSEIVGEGYRWEQAHPELFAGEVDAEAAIFFSRATRDYFGQVAGDYTNDYSASCLSLTRAGISCDVVTDIPAFGRLRCLVLSSAVCLSANQKKLLAKFLEDGGTLIATGPTGDYDERANPISKTWLESFCAGVEFNDPVRPGGFPPYRNFKEPVELAQCRMPELLRQTMHDGWLTVSAGKGRLLWRPERFSQKVVGDAVVKWLQAQDRRTVVIQGLPEIWQLRQYRDGDRLLIHALPGKVETVLHATLKNHLSGERIVEKIKFAPLTRAITLRSPMTLSRVMLHSPDLAGSRAGTLAASGKWSIETTNISRYFVLECWS
jgi:hypothetical protein